MPSDVELEHGILRTRALLEESRVDDALEFCSGLLGRHPQDPTVVGLMARCYLTSRKFAEAVPLLEKAILLSPESLQGYVELGVAKQALGHWDQAESVLMEACRRFPVSLEAWGRLAALRDARGAWQRSAEAYRRILSLRPDYAEALVNLGVSLLHQREFEAALPSFERALALKEDFPQAHTGRGVALRALNRCDDALRSACRAQELRPRDPELLHNIGLCLMSLGRAKEAIETYDRALALQPGLAAAELSKALALLVAGHYREGFTLYEARWRADQKNTRRRFAEPEWDGGAASLAGKTLLVYHEQGLGDTLQFVRYAPLLAAQGATVWLEVQPSLVDLAASVPGVTRVFATKETPTGFDLQCALLSLPRLMGTDARSIPHEVPYIGAAPADLAAWRARLGNRNRARIGLVCSGNAGHKDDHNRSIPLQRIAPFLEPLGADLLLLQKDVKNADARYLESGDRILSLSPHLVDFSNTAAAVSQMDVVVSVDTSVAHLSGALGRPTCVLLPFNPDWRWLQDREDSPWYPSARLFRQRQPGDWESAIGPLQSHLQSVLRHHRA